MPSKTIHALLSGFIDYAGLFPPAELEMTAAVGEFARQHRGKDAWMLRRFVVPVARLDEFERTARKRLPQRPSRRPWALSVLAGSDLAENRGRIDAFNRAHLGRAVIASVELEPADAEAIARAARVFEGLEIFYELPYGSDPGPLMAAVAAFGGRVKIRTGGTTADAIPTSAEVIRFLRAAGRAGISFKATAGLHHPLRGEYPLTSEAGAPKATLHGFLNVVLAAAWMKAAGLGDAETEELLEERSRTALAFDDGEVRWRDHRLSRGVIAEVRRQFALSCGSCSFKEPVRDLRALKML